MYNEYMLTLHIIVKTLPNIYFQRLVFFIIIYTLAPHRLLYGILNQNHLLTCATWKYLLTGGGRPLLIYTCRTKKTQNIVRGTLSRIWCARKYGNIKIVEHFKTKPLSEEPFLHIKTSPNYVSSTDHPF